MKTKTIALLLLALLVAAGAFATETPKMGIVALNDSKVYVAAETSTHSPTEITLLNARGETVYFKRTKAAPQFRSVLNLQELSDGTYTFSLKSGKAVSQREINVSNGTVTVKKVAEEFAPYFAYKNGKVLLSYLNSDQGDVSVLIYNGNKLVLDSNLGSDLAIQRSFDVSKLKNDQFELVLYGNNHRYNYRFTR